MSASSTSSPGEGELRRLAVRAAARDRGRVEALLLARRPVCAEAQAHRAAQRTGAEHDRGADTTLGTEPRGFD